MATGAPGHGEAAPGDYLQSSYRLWLAGHQLEHARPPWEDPYTFRPESGVQPNPSWWPFGLPYWPLWRALGSVLAWNLFTLLCLAAAGVFAFLWLRELGLAPLAAAAGGLAFELAPYRVEQSRGHLLGPISLLLPLALWALERALRSGRQRWWWLSRAAIVSIPLSGQVHLALAALPFYLLYGVCRARRDWLQAAAGALAGTLAGVVFRLTVISGSIDQGGRSLHEVGVYSATGLDFVSRSVRHGAESFVFLGWATPLAALAGLALLARARRFELVAALGVGALVPMLLALGTHFPLYAPLWHAFVPLRYPRVPERLMPVACLALAGLAAFAVDALLRRPEARRIPPAALAALLAAAFAADLHVRVFRPSDPGGGDAAYAAVRTAPKGALLELPVFLPDIHYGSVYLYLSQRAQRPRPAGYATTAPVEADAVARDLQPLGCGDWTREARDVLRRLDVSVITLHRALYADDQGLGGSPWLAWRGLVAHGWRPVVTDGPITTFVRGRSSAPPPFPEPPREEARFCTGWYLPDGRGRQMARSHAALWVYGGGPLRLYLDSPRPLALQISVDGRVRARVAGRRLREVRIDVSGRAWHLVALDAGRLPKIRGRPAGARLVAYALPSG